MTFHYNIGQRETSYYRETGKKMADSDFEFMSLDNQFLLDYHREELIKKINISNSVLLEILREKGTLTEQEDEFIRVRQLICYVFIFNFKYQKKMSFFHDKLKLLFRDFQKVQRKEIKKVMVLL